MLSVVLPEVSAVDNVKRFSLRGFVGGACEAWFFQRPWRWTVLSVVLSGILVVDRAERVPPRGPSGGPF